MLILILLFFNLNLISNSICWQTRNIISKVRWLTFILWYFWLRAVSKRNARKYKSLWENDRLDNVKKFHVEIFRLLVINPQVMPDPHGYWKQWEMNERRKCNYHSVHWKVKPLFPWIQWLVYCPDLEIQVCKQYQRSPL